MCLYVEKIICHCNVNCYVIDAIMSFDRKRSLINLKAHINFQFSIKVIMLTEVRQRWVIVNSLAWHEELNLLVWLQCWSDRSKDKYEKHMKQNFNAWILLLQPSVLQSDFSGVVFVMHLWRILLWPNFRLNRMYKYGYFPWNLLKYFRKGCILCSVPVWYCKI